MARGPSIKAVNLSEVRQEKKSAEQASLSALEASIDQDLKKRAGRSNLWIGSIAAIMSLYWAGAVSAFIWGLYKTGTIEPTPQWLATVLIFLILPIVFIWMVSLIAKRSQDLKAEANHLAAIALRLTHPEDQASREITRLGHAVRRQVEAMEKEMDLALTRVSQLDSTVRSQAKTLDKTAEDTQARIEQVRAGLESERENLEALAGKIEVQSQALTAQIENKTEILKTASSHVSETLVDADTNLQKRLEAIQKTSSDAMDRTRATTQDLSQQIEKLDNVSQSAVTQSESAGKVYEQHLESLGKATHLLAEEGRSLESKSRDHQNAIVALTKDVKDKVETIALGLQKSAHQIESALSDAKSSAEQIGDDFVRKAEDRTRKIESTVSDSASLIEATLDSLETQAGQIAQTIASQIEDTAAAVEGSIIETTNKFEDRLADTEDKIGIASKTFESNALAIEQQSREAMHSLTSAGETAESVANRARNVLRESAAGLKEDVEFSVAVFSDALEQMTDQNARLKSAFDSQDELLSHMPKLVAEQIDSIERLVSESANRVQKAVETTIEDAASLDGKIEEHARSFLTNGEDVLRALNASLERTRQESEETRTALTARTATIVSEIEAAGSAADHVIQKTENALLKRAESLKLLMSESDTHAETVTKAIEQKLAAGLLDIKGEIDQAERSIEEAIQRLAGTSGQIEDATSSANALLESTIGQMEERFKQFPEQAKDSGERIRSIVLTQISSLTDISEEAANRVLNLDAAFQSRIRGIYETLARLLPPAETTDAKALLLQQSPPLSRALDEPTAELSAPTQAQGAKLSQSSLPEEQKSRDIYPQIWDGMEDPSKVKSVKTKSTVLENKEPELQDSGLAKRLARRLKRDRNTRLSIETSDRPAATQLTGDDDTQRSTKNGAFENALRDALNSEFPMGSKRAKKMKWREILSAADATGETETPAYTPRAASISRTADHMVETLHAMTVDLSRALEKDAPTGLVERYLAGEQDLFAKRLAGLNRDGLGDRIQEKYKSDNEFRNHVDRYIAQFDRLETELSTKNGTTSQPPGEMTETRKVYELLKSSIATQE